MDQAPVPESEPRKGQRHGRPRLLLHRAQRHDRRRGGRSRGGPPQRAGVGQALHGRPRLRADHQSARTGADHRRQRRDGAVTHAVRGSEVRSGAGAQRRLDELSDPGNPGRAGADRRRAHQSAGASRDRSGRAVHAHGAGGDRQRDLRRDRRAHPTRADHAGAGESRARADVMDRRAMTSGPTAELMKEINAAFNSRDVDRIMSFFAEDCTFLMARGPEPEGRRVHGKAAVRKVLADRFRVITDMRWNHVDSFVTGPRAVTVWMVTGTGSDGEKLNYRGCDLYEFRGNKILNKDTYWKLVEQRDRL